MSCTAFAGDRKIGAGALPEIAPELKRLYDEDPGRTDLLVFDNDTGRTVELWLEGDDDAVVRRAELVARELAPGADVVVAQGPAGPGRPKLGVVAREVTLLPRHWAWLNSQPGGASVALRRLVEEARKANAGKDRVRQAQEAAYRFLSTVAGDRPGYEEAIRALYASNADAFEKHTKTWPEDVHAYGRKLAEPAFEEA